MREQQALVGGPQLLVLPLLLHAWRKARPFLTFWQPCAPLPLTPPGEGVEATASDSGGGGGGDRGTGTGSKLHPSGRRAGRRGHAPPMLATIAMWRERERDKSR